MLEHLETFVPQRSTRVEDVADRLRLNRHQARLFRSFHGLEALHEDPDRGLFELLLPAATHALRRVAEPQSIRYLIYAHTIQEVTPSLIDGAEVLRQALGLRGATAFALTQQNCASGLGAVDVAGELLRADGDPGARALVVTGEKAFSRLAQLIPNTAIMGEAAAAVVVGINGCGARVRSLALQTDGRFADGIRLGPADMHEFTRSYRDRVVDVMKESLRLAGVSLDDIALVVPHNVNRSSWVQVIRRLGIDRSRVYLDNVPVYSHCFCSDPFLNLSALRAAGRLEEGGLYLLTAVGLGATYAAMILEHRSAT